MAHFLLVHGAWHGAWCWERLVPELEALGHGAVAIDLPGHGARSGPRWRIDLAAYASAVVEAASSFGAPPVAVGHSLGGLVVQQAATDAPERFASLIYLAAFVPAVGESLRSLGARDPGTLVPASARYGVRGVTIRPKKARDVFYATCTPEDAAWATDRLQTNPWRPLLQGYVERNPLRLPRGYVACARDRALSLAFQREQARRAGIERIETLDTDHSPFLSAPAELAQALSRLAGEA